MLLDGARLQFADLDTAVHEYTQLLGVTPIPTASGVMRFQLHRGAVELSRGASAPALCFAAQDQAEKDMLVHGLVVVVHAPTTLLAAAHPDAVVAIDHVVVHTTAPERAITTWRDQHGLRLALDREFPQRHLRLQFFRSNKITLEYASPLPPATEANADRLFGISYRVGDLERTRLRLIDCGVDVSDIRPGMRPHTRVASVRTHTGDVPTLVLEVLDEPASAQDQDPG